MTDTGNSHADCTRPQHKQSERREPLTGLKRSAKRRIRTYSGSQRASIRPDWTHYAPGLASLEMLRTQQIASEMHRQRQAASAANTGTPPSM